MEREDYSAYTINLALAAICKATDEKMIDYEHKQRSVAEITRGTGERKHDVAAGHIDEELLTELMTAILDNTYDNDESLKLKLFNAISIEEEFYQ